MTTTLPHASADAVATAGTAARQNPLPMLTVVMPNYNHARFLEAAVTAIVRQTHPPDRFILIDDASTDESWALICRLAEQYPVIEPHRNEVNLGVVKTMNRGLAMADTDYMLFAAADDLVAPELFERSLSLLAAHPDAGLCSTLSVEIDEAGRLIRISPMPLVVRTPSFLDAKQAADRLVRHGPWMMGNTTVYRRAALLAVGGFREELRSFTDGFACIAIVSRYGACFIPSALGAWRKMDTGLVASSFHDVDWALGVIPYVRRIMGCPPNDMIPGQFIDRWEARWRYRVSLTLASETRKDRTAATLLALGRRNRLDRIAIGQLRGRPSIALKLYLFARTQGFSGAVAKASMGVHGVWTRDRSTLGLAYWREQTRRG